MRAVGERVEAGRREQAGEEERKRIP